MQADLVLGESRVLHLNPKTVWSRLLLQAARRRGLVGLEYRDFKARPHSDSLPSTRPLFLIVPFLVGQAFKHTSSLLGAKLIQTTTLTKTNSIKSQIS